MGVIKEIRKMLPAGIRLELLCDNTSPTHRIAVTFCEEVTDAPARPAAIEAAARDAAKELLRRAKAEGWRVSEDGESALCPACCGGQGGG